eukprot:TRINITY_DN59055_c0_g2_i1.p1 TRINITY_DN59055_c0_g2~~TRINITY_DN59055_c0_g2_i1.p1  ORF type:complete len:429 (+),score=96.87 TRINITY_DN59055_c0_g2_i1:1127-2413(+)
MESRFKKACLQVMAWSLTLEERQEFRCDFIDFDKTRTGVISLTYLEEVLERNVEMSSHERAVAWETLRVLDVDGDGTIHYSDFLAAMLQSRIAYRDDVLQRVFQRFDTENKGFITAKDFQSIIGKAAWVKDFFDTTSNGEGGRRRVGSMTFEDFMTHFEANQTASAVDFGQEDSRTARIRSVCYGFLGSAAFYVGSLFAVKRWRMCEPGEELNMAEDIIDIAHSVYTSAVASRGIACMRRDEVFRIALPPWLAGASGPVVRMFCHSAGYFLADTLFVLFEVCVRRRYPKQWAPRLLHHAVQISANLLSSFYQRPLASHGMRTGLCQAYFAEFSNIFLRLDNLARRAGKEALHRLLRPVLLVTFFFSRPVNFTFLISCWMNGRRLVPAAAYRFMLCVQAAGFAMNAAWFTLLLKGMQRAAPRTAARIGR